MEDSKKLNLKNNEGFKSERDFQKEKVITNSKSKKGKRSRDSFIPKEVANRMARRIAFTTGIPTLLGMGVFVLSYVLIIKGITDVPPSLTLTSSAIFFLIGLLGLSYGILSASWEEVPGSILGIENIRPNITKMRSAFQPINIENKK